VIRWYLEYRDGTSDKFHRTIVTRAGESWLMITNWGRRGSSGQSLVKGYKTSDAATDAAITLVRQKKRKGYQQVPDPLG